MADNTTLNTGSGGDTIAADDIGGVKYPRSKLIHGADGVNAGDVSTANPLPVSIYAGTTAIALGQALAAASLPVVLTAAQLATLTPLSTVAATQSGAWNVGTVTTVTACSTVTSVTGLTGGNTAHDAAASAVSPLLIGGYASAAAPTDVSTDTDAVRSWHLRNGAQCVQLTAAGALIGGDAIFGLKTQVTNAISVAGMTGTETSLALIDDAIYTDNDSWTDNASKFALIGGLYQSSPQTITDGRVAPLLLDANGRVVVAAHAVTQSGTWNIGTVTTVTTVSTVTNVATIGTSVTPGTSAAHLGKAEDAAHSSGDTGVFVLGVRADTPASTGQSDGDYTAFTFDSSGRLWCNVNNTVTVTVGSALPAGDNNIGNVDIVTMPNVTLAAGTNTNEVVGDAAHDAPVAGNPLLEGLEARTSLGTAVASGDVVRGMGDVFGRRVVIPGTIRDLVSKGYITLTDTTETTLITAVASTYLDLTLVVVNNTSATAVRVDFRDDTGGTVMFSVYAPAGQPAGFTPPRPIPQTAVNKNWTAKLSASVTDVRIFAMADQNK